MRLRAPMKFATRSAPHASLQTSSIPEVRPPIQTQPETRRTKLTLVAMNVYSATRPRGTQRGGHVALQRAVISLEGSCLSCADLHLTRQVRGAALLPIALRWFLLSVWST